MNRRLAFAYALWIGSFALFVWFCTLPGGTTIVALLASLLVLSSVRSWAVREPWRP